MRHEAGDRFESHSAGTKPKAINPLTVRVMSEVGIDISGHRSKHLREYLGRLPVSYVMIVCTEAEKACPRIWPGVLTKYSWPFDDPADYEGSEEARLEKFRHVRDQIRERIKSWLTEIEAHLTKETV